MGDASVSGETKQLQALHSLKILDLQPEARFERITCMAKRLFGVSIAVLCLDDRFREHTEAIASFEALRARGADGLGDARHVRTDGVFVVPDASADARFDRPPTTAEGRQVRFYASCPVHAADGRRMGALCLIDTAPHELSAEDLELLEELGRMVDEVLSSLSMATSDALTKLANRRGFEGIAGHILPMALRLHIPLALVQLDLDGLKQINDCHGHAAGDRTLVTFARHLLKNFRESDVVARLGGDEFCVLMSGASEPNVGGCLQRLEDAIGRAPGPAIHFSAGIATLDPERHTAIGDLLSEADERMYECKRGKRIA